VKYHRPSRSSAARDGVVRPATAAGEKTEKTIQPVQHCSHRQGGDGVVDRLVGSVERVTRRRPTPSYNVPKGSRRVRSVSRTPVRSAPGSVLAPKCSHRRPVTLLTD